MKAQDNERNFYTTESFEATLQAGIQGYLMSVDNNPDGTPSELKELVSKGSLLTYEGKVPDLFDSTKVGYVHIQTKDNQGNLSDVVTAQINANYAKVTLGIKPKSSTKMLDTFEVDTDGPNYKEKILNMAYPVIKDKEACDVFTIEISPSKQLEQVRYQFVESSTKPTFPTTTSPEWANIDRVNYSYPDATTGKLIEGTTTIGNLVTLPKEGLRVTQEIPLSDVPDKSGNFYFVLIVQDKDSPAREILYGPFIISDIIPNVIVDKNITEITNYIAPEGYSCIEIDTKFSPGATERSLALDLKSILGIENGEEDPLLKYDLEHPIYTIKNKAGKEGTPIGKTELKINDTKDGYMVIIENEVPDNYFDITIFIPTKLQPTTKYSKNGAAGTCLAILNGAKTDGDMNIPATATAKILVNKITKEDGTEELEYREVIKVNNRIMTYVPIPTVN